MNLLANKDFDVILRGLVIINNMVNSDKEVAEKLLATEVMEVLQAHIFRAQLDEGSYEPNKVLQEIKKIAQATLDIAHKMGLIKTKKEADEEPDSD